MEFETQNGFQKVGAITGSVAVPDICLRQRSALASADRGANRSEFMIFMLAGGKGEGKAALPYLI